MADLEKLTAAFPATAVKQRQVQGLTLDYVEGHTVIHRLNDATGNQWSMEVKSISSIDIREGWTQVTAHVALTIPGLGTREHIGIQDVHVKGPDLVKGAVTDALKKAATLFGVGLELYGPDYESGEIAPGQWQQPQQLHRQPAAPRDINSARQGQSHPRPGPGLITDPQRQLLLRLAGECNRDEEVSREEFLRGQVLARFEDVGDGHVGDLTKQMASALIDALRSGDIRDAAAPHAEARGDVIEQSPWAVPDEPEWLQSAPRGEAGYDQHTS